MIFFSFLFAIIALIVLFEVWARKYESIYLCKIYFGKKGVGKSSLLHKHIERYYNKGFYLYCNIGDTDDERVVQFPVKEVGLLAKAYKNRNLIPRVIERYKKKYKEYVYLRSDKEFLYATYESELGLVNIKFPLFLRPDSVIFCDEINLVWDNRAFKDFTPEQQEYFRKQRHFKHIFLAYSQTYDVDKKIRDLCDLLILLRKRCHVFTRVKCYFKNPIVVSPNSDNGRETATITDDYENMGFLHNFFSNDNLFIPKWVKKHDSFK